MAGSRVKAGPAVAVLSLFAILVSACTSDPPKPAAAPPGSTAAVGGSAALREPVTLASQDGVLEVKLSAHQGTAVLDTVSAPVTNFLVFGYELIKGTASDGSTKGDNLYPAPTLRVDPGQRLIVHLDNELKDLTVQDFYDPAMIPTGQPIPLYRTQMTEAPMNLHTHGLHVSPDGNVDNVLLDIPSGMANTYDYDIPTDMPNGMYWYHSHLHTLTAEQTYMGLAGMLEIGRPDGNLPAVTQNNIPIRDMALQYNYVFDRKGGGKQLNQPNWPQYVSTLKQPDGTQLADGTYVPLLSPVNFSQSAPGTQYFTNWWTGPLSEHNHRGQSQFVPSNLQSFTAGATGSATTPYGTAGTGVTAGVGDAPTTAAAPGTSAVSAGAQPTSIPADPSLPDSQRDVQYTVNGQFQPSISIKPGQTEIWVLANISDFAYTNVTLTETATGNHPKIAIVGQDGNPFPEVHLPTSNGGTTLTIPPGSRYAIAVTMPKTGDLVLEMPPEPGAKSVSDQAIAYTNNGTDKPPAELGTVTLDSSNISYFDGFFLFPTQVLARAKPDTGDGTTTPFVEGQPLGAYTSFVNTAAVTPDVTRQFKVTGGFDNDKASKEDSMAFVYDFDGNTFPNTPLIQPRLGSTEEWTLTNYNNDEHPIHIHVNDFQVMQIVDPERGTTGVQMWGEDNVNLPFPLADDAGNVITPGSVTLRTKFTEYTGTYVIHCHRLNHEDQGLMAIVNVIPAVSSYAAAVPGGPGKPATVQLYDGNGDKLLKTVTPFPGFDGTPSVSMADVNGDQVLDLVAGTGEGANAEVVAYSGAADAGGAPFETELTRFAPFGSDFQGGVNVAAADIDGNGLASNIVVGSGPGIGSQVKVYDSKLPTTSGTAPDVFSSFTPFDDSKAGVNVATGMVDASSGRPSIVTASGAGATSEVKVYRFDLYEPAAATSTAASTTGTTDPHAGHSREAAVTADFYPFGQSYQGGVSLATGWVAGAEGGAKSIITSMQAGPGTVKVFSSGSALDGQPLMYVESPNHHGAKITFLETASFDPFGSAGAGVRAATTSTLYGADVLVSGPSADATSTEVRKYQLNRSDPTATTLTPQLLNTVVALPGSSSAPLGGE